MATAHIKGYGEASFDPMTYKSNAYNLYAIAICDKNGTVTDEEHYTDESEYHTALYRTEGREYWDEQTEDGWCDVWYNGDYYECKCTYHIAYVTDNDQE